MHRKRSVAALALLLQLATGPLASAWAAVAHPSPLDLRHVRPARAAFATPAIDLLALRDPNQETAPSDPPPFEEPKDLPPPPTFELIEEETQEKPKPWWAWTGSAVIVGLFVAGLSYDLRHDRAPADIPEPLPDFPPTP